MAELQLTPPPPGPPLPAVATPATSGSLATNIPVNQSSAVGDGRLQNATQYVPVNYKSLLQQYAQKARLLLPDYAIVNEGYPHAPQFRGTVSIGGEKYTSPNTFAHRKAAEQDAARHAMESMPPITKKEELQLLNNIHEDKMFCKSILNELVMKINVENPTYHTVQPDASVQAFKCTVVFNGRSYTGEAGRNKKEAERLAARAVIVSLLESEHKTILSEIIQSKDKLYASINKVKDCSPISTGDMLTGVTGKGVLMENNTASQQSSIVQHTTTQVTEVPHHEFKKPGLEHSELIEGSCRLIAIPPTGVPTSVQPNLIVFVQPTGEKKRKRKSKNKAKKHSQVGSQVPLVLAHPSQVS
ncbi:double-stranded RNA-binding protein 4-like [Ipomoea triloba]|uniref:double-stranded RNA-binding protein 4-like n=1 Tax=Ipomoea triloba TaxID=35885 RepID=UPI00125E5CCF|nr:double-stranded RNA-binding protein 4-like [Ipomoea triloba]XP_031114787.1 double-stranded RNA-binding protein 4-like [Ipomoea triloba]